MNYTLIHISGATKGSFKSYEGADNYRLCLDDWWLWEVVKIDEI